MRPESGGPVAGAETVISTEPATDAPETHDAPTPAPDPGSTPSNDELARLTAEHADGIFRVAISIVRDAALAEDVVQETLLKAWTKWSTFRAESSERSWVLQIGRNTAISLLRKRREELVDPDDWSMASRPSGDDPAARATDDAFRHSFELALFELDELTRSVLVLREVEQLSYDEIATTLGVPMATVKTRIMRGRRQLAQKLEGWR